LNALRTAIENLSIRQSTITGGAREYFAYQFRDMQPAVTALKAGFRTKLDHLRTIMRSSSHVDIRGCEIGKDPTYLTDLRSFLGMGTNQPTISAPDWFQSYPTGTQIGWGTSIFTKIDAIVSGGLGQHFSAGDVDSAFTKWKGLIDFDPHFSFIRHLFTATTPNPLFDFATLEWRVWRTGSATKGIPILRMEAERIDDIVSPKLGLGDIIERFRVIFEIPAASAPNPTLRVPLNNLQPHILTFKTIRAGVAPITSPNDPALNNFHAPLTKLAKDIKGVKGFPAPQSPLPPASASFDHILDSVINIQAHIFSLLTANVDVFFTAVKARLNETNSEIRYYYNIGLPLPVQSSAPPANPNVSPVKVSTFMSATSNAEGEKLVANALRSWMRVQWTGTAAQAAKMNAQISQLSITNAPQRDAASQVSRLQKTADPTPDAAVNPMPDFQAQIVTRPKPNP
jgi:hypothetical protein